jgi:hypothetical protein
VSSLVAKLLLAPAFVVAATMVVRRFGPVVGGVVGGLPVVAGPILLTFALEHGEAFAARAAVATTLGLISLTAFVVVYGWLADRRSWVGCLAAGWAAFLAATAALDRLDVSAAGIALALACTTFLVVLRLVPGPAVSAPVAVAPPPPRWDLPLRVACVLALVLVVTAVAGALGPRLSGLLAPFPIVTGVLAAFTHAQADTQAVRGLLRGFLFGFFAFALFCFVVAVLVEPLGIAAAFALATLTALLVQLAVLAVRTLRAPRVVLVPADEHRI